MSEEHRIREIDPTSDVEVKLVATRMRETLVEVLGEERGRAMYTMDWLVDRVRFHLDPSRVARVFLSVSADERITGHTIVRVERDDTGREFGLFSTTFVEPASRRQGIARALLLRGERWMIDQRLPEAATYTSDANLALIDLYRREGYAIVDAQSDMVRLSKRLA